MKKILSILLVTMMILMCFAGCGKDNEPTNTDTPSTTVSDKETQASEETSNNDNTDDWGVQEKIVATKNDVISVANIKFPSLTGIVEGTGKIAYQKDKTLVILDAEMKEVFPNITANSCEEVFPAYFEQTRAIMDAYRQMNYDNFDFSVANKETVTVNGYEMCKYIGKHTFTVNGENDEMDFVAYATKLNGNGAYVYWMVLDESEDQSLTKTIEEYADKMAKTLSE